MNLFGWIGLAVAVVVMLALLASCINIVQQSRAYVVEFLGETAKVTWAVDNENAAGAVYVDGKTWTARSADGSAIPAGTRVMVERIEGVKLFVKPCEKNEEVRK